MVFGGATVLPLLFRGDRLRLVGQLAVFPSTSSYIFILMLPFLLSAACQVGLATSLVGKLLEREITRK